MTLGSNDLINLSTAIAIIREQGIYGEGYSQSERENDVINMLECLPPADLSCLWHDAVSDPPLESGYYLVFCEGRSVPEVLYFRGKKWACESSPYRKPIFWTEYPPLPKEVNP